MRATRLGRVVRMGAAENRAHERFRHERDTLSDPGSGVGGSAFAVDPRVCCVRGWGREVSSARSFCPTYLKLDHLACLRRVPVLVLSKKVHHALHGVPLALSR